MNYATYLGLLVIVSSLRNQTIISALRPSRWFLAEIYSIIIGLTVSFMNFVEISVTRCVKVSSIKASRSVRCASIFLFSHGKKLCCYLS